MKKILLLTFAASLLVCPLSAQIASELNYQATVTDDAGALIADAAPESYDVSIRLFSASSGGEALWSEVHTTSIFKGRFSIILGLGTPIGDELHGDLAAVLAGGNKYVETTLLAKVGNATPKTLLPRQKLVATATALRAQVANTVATGAITNQMLASNSINTANIQNATITADDLATNAVGSDEIATNAVGQDEIATNAVGQDEIRTNAVGSDEIINGSVTGDDIANNTITAINIAANAVGSSEILDNSITAADIGSNAVGTSEIVDGSIQSVDIAAGGVGTSELSDGAVTVAKASLALTAPNFLPLPTQAVTDNRIRNLWASAGSKSGYNFTSSFVPAGARGVILRVRLTTASNAGGISAAIIFNDSNGNLPDNTSSALGLAPWQLNSVIARNTTIVTAIAKGDVVQTVFVPFLPNTVTSSTRRIEYIHSESADVFLVPASGSITSGDSWGSLIGFF